MLQEQDILLVVVSLIPTIGLLLRVARINPFQDAQPAKIWKRDLQLPKRLSSGKVLGSDAGFSRFLHATHLAEVKCWGTCTSPTDCDTIRSLVRHGHREGALKSVRRNALGNRRSHMFTAVYLTRGL